MRSPHPSSVVGSGFVVWGLAIGLIRLHDNSFLTELATGRIILSRGIPHADPFSFTAHGHSWVLESWLADVLYAVVDRVGGDHGLQLLHAALAVVLAVLVWRLTRPARSLVGRILVAAAALVVGTGYWSPRPLLIALVCLALVVVMAEEQRIAVWWAVPLMWIWLNVHGSWPLGLGYLVLRMGGRALARQPLGHLPRLTAAVAGGTLLGLANPFGWRLLAYPSIVITHHLAFSHIVEWESPNFADPITAAFLAASLVALILVVARRGTLEDALVTTVFLAAACLASRNVPVASIVTLPVLARGLAGLGTVIGARRSPAALAGAAAVVAVGAMLVGGALGSPGFDLSAYPVAAVTWMHEHDLVPGRVATQDFVGNYLEYRYGAGASAFIDDRVDMYPESVEQAYGALLSGDANWQSVLDRYQISTVLWARNQPLGRVVSVDPKWRVVYRDRHWMVAVEAGASSSARYTGEIIS